MALDESEQSRTQQGAARTRKLLHPRGDMSGLAHRGVVHTEVVPDGAHHDLSRVEPNADLYDDAMTAEDFVGMTSQAFVHAERRIAGPDSVILVSEWRSEQRHDPVAHDLVNRSFVPVHCI